MWVLVARGQLWRRHIDVAKTVSPQPSTMPFGHRDHWLRCQKNSAPRVTEMVSHCMAQPPRFLTGSNVEIQVSACLSNVKSDRCDSRCTQPNEVSGQRSIFPMAPIDDIDRRGHGFHGSLFDPSILYSAMQRQLRVKWRHVVGVMA